MAHLKIKVIISKWNLYKRKVLNNYGGLYMKKLIAEEYKRFEDIKQTREEQLARLKANGKKGKLMLDE